MVLLADAVLPRSVHRDAASDTRFVLRVPVFGAPAGSASDDGGDVREVAVIARELTPDMHQVLVDGHHAGFVRRDGHVFIALSGPTPAHAAECGRGLLWDEAAARLLD